MSMRIGGDSIDGMDRADSAAGVNASFSSIHLGVLTAKNDSTRTGFVKIAALNSDAQLGPYKFMASFTFPVATPVKQTLTVSNGTADPGVSVVTGVSLSATTTDISGVYSQTLTLPAIGTRVLVVLLNDSLDEGVIVGSL
jgi:hypothetical protein